MDEEFLRSAIKAAEAWTSESLEDLRREAAMEETGVSWKSIKRSDGFRIALVVCITGEDRVKMISDSGILTQDTGDEDWSCISLGDVLIEAAASRAITGRLLNSSGRIPLAAALISADPLSTKKLGGLFSLP